MSQLLSPDTFDFFASYLLAGYVVIIVRSRFVAGLRPKPSELLVEAILFSLVNQLLASMLVEASLLLGLTDWLDSAGFLPSSESRVYFFAKVLILPTILGVLLGYNLTAGWKNALLRRLSLPVIHPVQKGHDFAFGNDREPAFVIVTYFDGTTVGGYFGENSLAASDTNRSDLYLERLYSLGDEGVWEEPKPSRSGLINLQNVRSIEFLDNEGDQNVE
ncbi:MAG: DUF6338 family protein [Roseovarius sp.]